jgi:hypothetical protein
MKTTQQQDMDFIKLTEYIHYALTPVTNNKGIILFTTVVIGILAAILDSLTTAVNWLSMVLIIHSMFIIMYAILSGLDWITGLIAGVIVEKKTFNSGKFFKKPFLIMFCLLMLYATVALSDTFTSYPHKDNPLLQATLSTVVFLFEGMKVGLMVAFVVYEMTSLRENFIRLQMEDFARVLDLFLIPFIKIQNYLGKKFDKTIDDEIGGATPISGEVPVEKGPDKS